jgi:hypothetical protein
VGAVLRAHTAFVVLLLIVAALAIDSSGLLAQSGASGPSFVLAFAAAATTITTGGTAVNKVWRKIQGKVATGFQFMCEEYSWIDELPSEDIDWSQRETLVPLDINEEVGVAIIPEGGYLARPSSVNMEEISVSLSQFSARFNASRLSKFADKGLTNQVEKQLKYQAAKKVQAMGRKIADHFYGTSVATLATTDSDLSGTSGTLTLTNAFGSSSITNAAYVADRFRVNEWVAAINGSSLVANAIGQITARSTSTPSITVTWNGTVSDATNGLKIVGANSMENTTISGTDYNMGLVGLLDILTSTTVHGLSSSTVPAWNVAKADTAGGRLSPVRVTAMDDEIANKGGGKLNTLLLAQGVYRDWVDAERAAVRFDTPASMETDGSVKSKGRDIKKSRRVPPGFAIGYDKRSWRKIALTPKPDGSNGITWGDGKEYIDQDGMVFNVDLVLGLVCTNRGNFAYASGLTEQ